MGKLRSWWQKIRKRPAFIVVIIACISVIVFIIIVTWLNGTGFEGYDKVTTTRVISGPTAGTVTKTEEYQPGKTLWDILGVLAIPIVVSLGAAWYSSRHNHELEIAQLQHENDREIALDNQRGVLLQTYLDKMSELLLHENLRKSEGSDEVRNIARVLTIVVLPGLDSRRKVNVFQFLRESGLIYYDIDNDLTIISLSGADLTEVNLHGATLNLTNLEGADLRGAILSEADLSEANLEGADLRGAHLVHVILDGALLEGANLEGAILEGADLGGADLSRANLSRANLWRADLSRANLWRADLYGADLSEANLEGAILKDAYCITSEVLEKVAKSLKGAIMPDGTKHD